MILDLSCCTVVALTYKSLFLNKLPIMMQNKKYVDILKVLELKENMLVISLNDIFLIQTNERRIELFPYLQFERF